MKDKITKLPYEEEILDEFIEIDEVLNKKQEVIGINSPMLNTHLAIDTRELNS